MLTRVWRELEYRIDVCRVTCRAHIEHLLLYTKISFPVDVTFSNKVGPLVFLLQMFVITENFMKRPVYIYIYKLKYSIRLRFDIKINHL